MYIRVILMVGGKIGTYHEGRNACVNQSVNKVAVILDALWVNRVEAATQGNDAGPSDRETVSLDAVVFQESNVFLPEFVRVGSDIAVASVSSLSRSAREVIPDGLAPAVDVGRAFNLEGSYKIQSNLI